MSDVLAGIETDPDAPSLRCALYLMRWARF